ncbi:MAG TPA: Ig-like domain-containing protein, partial [Lacipirellulaceae bacterium]|nr:Ig-like domain-containing protein [Lacipirellulaceae bacterium]
SIAPTTDQLGAARVDDPGTSNLGTPAGLPYVDLGAFEFQGSSLDVTPPQILSTTPAGVDTSATLTPFSQITLNLSEAVNSIDAQAAANYELRSGGANHVVGDSDDVVINITPTYTPGSSSVVLLTSGLLPTNNYRLTVFGSNGRALHDLAGLVIDGDNNGAAGGDYVRNFTVVPLPGDYNLDNTVDSQDYQTWRSNFGATSGPALAADGSGNGIVDAADYVLWRKHASTGGAGAGSAAAAASNLAPESTVSAASSTDASREQQNLELSIAANTTAQVDLPEDSALSIDPRRYLNAILHLDLYADAAIPAPSDSIHHSGALTYLEPAREQVLRDWRAQPSAVHRTSSRMKDETDTAAIQFFDEANDNSQKDTLSESAVDSALDELFVVLI